MTFDGERHHDVPPVNPFIAKAEAASRPNPFIERALRVQAACEANSEQPVEAKSAPSVPKVVPTGQHRFPTHEYKPITDEGVYNDVSLAGVKFHDFKRDSTGLWICKVTVNEETFECRRFGGWQIIHPEKGIRGVLPKVAVVMQAVVRQLEKKYDPPPPPEKKIKKSEKENQNEIENTASKSGQQTDQQSLSVATSR
jgi:hypothetical protein